MMKNNTKKIDNFLERKPMRRENLEWDVEADGKVVLFVRNTGVFNRIAQKLFRKPPITNIHLDEIGSFLWPLLDGNSDIIRLGKLVEEEFGQRAYPIYERLAKYFQILDSYSFISWNDIDK